MAATAAIGQAATDILGSALGAVFAQKQAKKAHDRSVHSYRHRYQWTMEDMRKAGLNPILAYQQGAGSFPSSQKASQPAVKTSNYAATAKQIKMMTSEMNRMDSETARNWAASELSAYQANTHLMQQPYLVEQAKNEARRSGATATLEETYVPRARADETFYNSEAGQRLRYLERLLGSMRGARRPGR